MTQTTEAFKTALQFTLRWEGGAGHPDDLAGTVYRGISQASYDTYRKRKNLALQPVGKVTEAEVENLYFEDYWLASKADLMCLPLAVVHFDTAVNFSVRSSIRFLQETIGGLTADGNFGPRSAAALQGNNNAEIAKKYCQNRINYRHERVKQNSTQQKFLQGWLRRDNDLMTLINQLATQEKSATPTQEKPPIETKNPVSSSDAGASVDSSKADEKNEQVMEKLEQAIGLLQEVVVLLKKSK